MNADKEGPPVRCPVLVVEDDPDIRDALELVLTDAGYQPELAVNGREGLDKLYTIDRPCLILLDLMMPVMNGAEFLAHLRADEELSPIPVVIVSAWGKEVEQTENIQGFVPKPVDVDVLLAQVERYC